MKTFQMCPETRQLIGYILNRLKEDPDGVVTWEEMEKAVGLHGKRARLRGYCKTARDHILNDESILTVPERGVGIRRTKKYDIYAGNVRQHVNRVTRRAGRAVPRAMEGDPDIPNDMILRTNVNLSVLGALELCSKPQTVKKIEQGITEQNKGRLIVGDVLKMFGKE